MIVKEEDSDSEGGNGYGLGLEDSDSEGGDGYESDWLF